MADLGSSSIESASPREPELRASKSPIWRLVAANTNPLIVMNDGTENRHIYCVHSVTGDVGALAVFASHFGAIRLVGIQVPKKDMLLHVDMTIEAMAARYVDLIEAFQPNGSIHLIGWSAGAIVALEMAQQLRARGRVVPLIVALDGAPCNTGAGLSKRDPRYLWTLIANVPRWVRDDRSSDWTLGGILRRISEKLTVYRGARTALLKSIDTLDAEVVERLIARKGWSPTQKAFVHSMYQAMACYVPMPYDGRALVFETVTQPLFHLRQIGQAWKEVCPTCEIVRLDTNHSGLVYEKSASRMATDILHRIS